MKNKQYLAYVLIDPITNIPRYVGITTRSLEIRFLGHMNDVRKRPDLNPHKTNWFNKLLYLGKIPKIKLIKQCQSLEELKQFEIDYIKKYKIKYNLINLTTGGDMPGENAWSRETILKKSSIRSIVQYNILGEKIQEYDIIEDAVKALNLETKAGSHITQCCKGYRKYAYGYIWRYKGENLGDISNINPRSLDLNYLVQYDSKTKERLNTFTSAKEAAAAIGVKSSHNISSVISGKQKTCGGYIWKLEPKFIYFNQKLFDSIYNNDFYDKNKNNTGINIICYDLSGKELKRFNSISKAAKTMYPTMSGATRRYITKCCKGELLEYKGLKWKQVSINPSNSGENLQQVNPELIECETTIETLQEQSTPQAYGGGNGGNLGNLN